MLTSNIQEQINHEGFKCLQVWVPDTNDPEFIAECKRQSHNLQNDLHEKEVLDWIESVTDLEE